MSEAKLIEDWNVVAQVIDDDPMRPYRYGLGLRYLKDKARDINILEIGCGEGSGLLYLGKAGFKNLYGVEVSPERIKRASEKLPPSVKLQVIKPEEKLPFPDRFFDAVVSLAVIEHTISPKAFMEEINRVLKPGGDAVISSDCYSWRILQALGSYNTVQPIDQTITPFQFLKLFEQAGFEIVHLDTFNFPPRGNIYLDAIKNAVTDNILTRKLAHLAGKSKNLNGQKKENRNHAEKYYHTFQEHFNSPLNDSKFYRLLKIMQNYTSDENLFLLKKTR